MNKIIKKGSIVRNGYDPRILGEVVGFKILKGKRIPLVKYGEQIILDKESNNFGFYYASNACG